MKTKIPFVGPSYQARSLNVDSQRSLNCFIEMDNASPRAPVALYGTPGTVSKVTLPTVPVRQCITAGAYSWWVSGNTVYRISSAFDVVAIGTIATGTGLVSMASNGAQILIVDGVNGWLVDIAGPSLIQVLDGDFPNGVKIATFQDGYFIVTGLATSQAFYICQNPYDGGTWDALDFASAEGSPDYTLGVISDHRELWLFGSDSTEIWTNTGAADFPFARSGNVFIEHGCLAAATVAKADNTLLWLGSDSRGSCIVWRANGYTPTRISTHAIEHAISGYAVKTDAYAFTYQQEGHIFYVLTFPTANATWVYDIATGMWHERAWRHPDTGNFYRWRPSCICFFAGMHLAGDYEGGNILLLDMDVYTDNTTPILRLRSTSCTEQDQNRVFYTQLQVDLETGIGDDIGQGEDPQLMLRYSNDGGHTWSNEKTATAGKIGEYAARAQFTRMGAGRNRVWELSMSDPVKFCVMGAVVMADKGLA